MHRTVVSRIVALVATLAVNHVAAATPLEWCPSEVPVEQPAPAPIPPGTAPKSISATQPSAGDGQLVSSAAKFDAFVDRLVQGADTPVTPAEIAKFKSHTIQEKARLGMDVEALTGSHSTAEIAELETQPLQDATRVIREREWLSTNGARIDPRVTEGILGADPQSMTAPELNAKQDEFANLAGTYLRGARDGTEQHPPPSTGASIDTLMATIPHQDTAQMDPGTPTDQGGLAKVKPNTPVVVDTKRQCIRHASTPDWKPDAATNSLPIAFDPLGFPEVGLLLRRLSVNGGQPTYYLCSFTMIRRTYALTAAHCAYSPDSGTPQEIAGLRDARQTLALLPVTTSGPRNPTACFNGPATSGCLYVVASVAASFVPDNFHWMTTNPVPDQDIAILQLKLTGTPTITSANLMFTVPAERRITVAGYGLTTDTLIAPKGAFQVGWQDINAITQYGLRWVPNAQRRMSNPCPGDSGGPIFTGDQYGVPLEQHRLTAIVSRIDALTSQEAASHACLDRPGIGVVIAGYQDWICKVIAGPLEVCTH